MTNLVCEDRREGMGAKGEKAHFPRFAVGEVPDFLWHNLVEKLYAHQHGAVWTIWKNDSGIGKRIRRVSVIVGLMPGRKPNLEVVERAKALKSVSFA